VSVEDGTKLSRVRHLQQSPAGIRILSIEPLIGDVGKLDLAGIAWVIVSGESGPGFRPMEKAWVRSIRDQCKAAGVAFFFKQWGGVRPKTGGRKLDRREWNQYPNPLSGFTLAAE
jgi:protein gp37